MADHHTLQIGATSQTLVEWGVTSCVVRANNLRGDQMEFVIPVDDVSAAPIASFGTTIRLYTPDGVCGFVGTCGEPIPEISGDKEAHRYIVRGPSWRLERCTYQQPWRFPADVPDELIGPDTEMYEEEVSLVTLFRNYADGTKVDLEDQLVDGINQGISQLTAEGFAISASVEYIPAVSPPEDQKRDLSVLDLIECCLRWCPNVLARWDYSSGTPVLRFSRTLAFNPTTGVAGVSVSGLGLSTRTLPVTALRECKPVPLDEQCIAYLEIAYLIVDTAVTEDDTTIIWRRVERDVSPGGVGFGTQTITVELRGVVYDGEEYTDPEPRPPDGLAAELHQAFGRVWWDLELTKVAQEVVWDYQIGEAWNVSGIGSGPAAANSVCQEIVRDIMLGTTSISTGAPSHLGLDDIMALLMANRVRTVPSKAGDQQYGFGENEKKGNDLNGAPIIEIENNGATEEWRFQGAGPVTP